MNSITLEIVKNELSNRLTGQRFGKIFPLSRNELAIDLRLNDSRYLYINFGTADPSTYLITRRLKDLDKASVNMSSFAMTLRKKLSGAGVLSVRRRPDDRIVEIEMRAEDEFGAAETRRLVLQLTGRSANLFLTDAVGLILDRARETAGDGQQIAALYLPPARIGDREERSGPADRAVAAEPDRASEILDAFYTEQAEERAFQAIAKAAAGRIAAEIRKREKLVGNLDKDLANHGSAAEWKKIGDLLLSNASTAKREGGIIHVTDYFDENLAEIAVDAKENESVTEAAERYYRRYTKARNAAAEISARRETLSGELDRLEQEKAAVEKAVEERDTALLEDLSGRKQALPEKGRGNKTVDAGGVSRRFVSSDGFEILVGKKARDNDVLTFKLAKSLDTWMHAADYPGSHVVIKNPNRAEIPQRTMHEAAQLAAFYSQGKAQTKAAVHYTQKKFVNKPKGAAPGLVSLASFKTILVVPEFPSALEIRQ